MIAVNVPSQTTSGVTYVVRETDRERITCTCPGYRKRGHCKHTIAYVAASRYANLGAIKAIEKARGWFYGA